MAPAVSIARWTPKAVPSPAGVLLSEISASRGAVRIPLPVRSTSTIPATELTAPPTSSSAPFDSAESP